MGYILALDIGGTNTRFRLRSTTREVFGGTVDTDPTSAHETLCAVKARLLQFSNVSLGAIAVGVAGAVKGRAILTGSGNLPGWSGVNLAELFGQLAPLPVPVTVLNDCEAAALGEYSVTNTSLVYVGWGSGVGVSIVTEDNGKVSVRATELGHATIDASSPLKCGCGGFGHLEALVGGNNLEKRFGASPNPSYEGSMTRRHWDEALYSLAQGLRGISCGFLDLPVVLGGGVMIKQQHRLPQLQELVDGLSAPAEAPRLTVSRLGEDAGLHGVTARNSLHGTCCRPDSAHCYQV